MNVPKDPKLAAYAYQLPGLAFQTQLSADSEKLIPNLQLKHQQNHMRVAKRIPGQAYGFLLQMYCGGELRTLCTMKDSSDFITAARLADLFTHSIGRFRLRFEHTPKPHEYNLSPEQAQLDWEKETAIVSVIKEMEHHLRAIGALSNSPDESKPKEVTYNRRLADLERKMDAVIKKLNSFGGLDV